MNRPADVFFPIHFVSQGGGMRNSLFASRTSALAISLLLLVLSGLLPFSAETSESASEPGGPVVEKILYLSAKHVSEEELANLTGIQVGAPLNPRANKAARRAIVRRLNDLGRPFAACDLLRGGAPQDREVIFNITEGPRVKPGHLGTRGGNDIESDLARIYDPPGVMGHETQAQATFVYTRDAPGVVIVDYEVEEQLPAPISHLNHPR